MPSKDRLNAGHAQLAKSSLRAVIVSLIGTFVAFVGCAQNACAAESAADRNNFHGMADYYHHSLYGKKTASGQVLQKDLLTAAHRTLPFGTRVHVTNKRTGKSCVVVINDRGPYTKTKIIDLSHAAASQLGLLQAGTGHVACTVLKPGECAPGKKPTMEAEALPIAKPSHEPKIEED